MVLHNDKENFDIAIRAASRYFNVSPAIVYAPTPDIITVPAITEIADNNLPMVASGTDETVLSGQSIIGGVNSVSLAVSRA